MKYAWERPIYTAAASDLPRLQLVTVEELKAICPICEKPRQWAQPYCSVKCAKRSWQLRNRERLNSYWREWWNKNKSTKKEKGTKKVLTLSATRISISR